MPSLVSGVPAAFSLTLGSLFCDAAAACLEPMSERKSRRWTADDLALLRLLAERDEPVTSIAAAQTRTVQAVRTKAAHERVSLQEDVTRHGPRRQQPFATASEDNE